MNPKLARPFRNSGIRYIPKKRKVELGVQQRVCQYLRKNYPEVIFHSDYAANADLSEHQQKVNKSLQFGTGFPDLTIYKRGRVNKANGERYVGLALELKKEGTPVILKIGANKGRLTSDPHIRHQATILRRLIGEGWYANFAVGYDEAVHLIDWYFETPRNATLF